MFCSAHMAPGWKHILYHVAGGLFSKHTPNQSYEKNIMRLIRSMYMKKNERHVITKGTLIPYLSALWPGTPAWLNCLVVL